MTISKQTECSRTGIQPSNNKGHGVDVVVNTALGIATNKREAQSIANLIQAGKAKMTRTKN